MNILLKTKEKSPNFIFLIADYVMQDVFIAVPITMSSGGFAAIAAILPEGKYSANVASAAAKAVADAEIVAKVKDTALKDE